MPRTLFITKLAAVVALGWPTSLALNVSETDGSKPPEEKLPIEIRNIDGIHINHMDIFEPGKGQIL